MSKHPRLALLLVLAAALIPCFWQSRIQAGDLSSHIYNAWLAQLVSAGQAPGIVVAPQTTNVLFDWLLSAFLPLGAGLAQRFAVVLAVLAFVSGAFAFVRTVSGRDAWEMLAWILPLAYGWVFHIGFFNFYLALGLSFWALSLAWEFSPRRMAMAVPLLVVAYVAHALPVLWAIAVLAYVWMARYLGPERGAVLLGGAVAAIVVLRIVAGSLWTTRWSGRQFMSITGLDQLSVYDDKYQLIAAAMLLFAVLRFLRLLRTKVGLSIPLQIFLLTAAGVALLPGAILLTGYKHYLAFIAERMSLTIAVLLCALLAVIPLRPWERYASTAVAVLFFLFLYRDESALNAFEDRMATLVDRLPANQRVVSGVDAPGIRINALSHMIDRVCVGHCYSYANYEPSTAQFRVRVTAPNPIVAATYEDSFTLQLGTYVVKPADVPLYQVVIDQNGHMGVRAIDAGVQVGMTYWNPL
jgi:hypothetical protein